MKLLQQLRNFTLNRSLIAILLSTIASAQGLWENTLETGQNLFTPVPLSVMTAGAGLSYLSYRAESKSGYQGFLPEKPFSTIDQIDNFLFAEFLPLSAATMWLTGKLSDSAETEELGQELCRGLVYTYGLVQTLKITTDRIRPDGSNTRSFPSGHAAGSACLASVMWGRYGADIGLPFTAIAIYTCLSRVNLGKHFPSDVILGAAIGTAFGIAASSVNNQQGNFSFSLSINTEGRIFPGL